MNELPEEAQKALQQVIAEGKKNSVFVALPSLLWTNSHMSRMLFDFAMDKETHVNYHFLIEQRFHDWARNRLVRTFLSETKMDWILMLDADVMPNPHIMKLASAGKEIIAATVFCWIKRQLMPSIWQRAACEHCEKAGVKNAIGEFKQKNVLKDPSRYRIHPENETILQRWDGIKQKWQSYYNKKNDKYYNDCICEGTGLDPWTYKVHPDAYDKREIFECDSVGAAALLAHRSIFDKIPFPWFKFVYKESREMMCTEDHYFCWNAKRSGFKIHADPTMICGHFKTMDLAEVNRVIGMAYKKGMEHEKNSKKQSNIIIPDFPVGVVPIKK